MDSDQQKRLLQGLEVRSFPPQGCENADAYIGNPWIVTLVRYITRTREKYSEHMESDEVVMVERHLAECASCREMTRNMALAEKGECQPDVEEEILDLLIGDILGTNNVDDSEE